MTNPTTFFPRTNLFFGDLVPIASSPQKGAVATSPVARDPLADAKRQCEMSQGKPAAVHYCYEQAKRAMEYRRNHPEAAPKPKTALEKEVAHCETLGKSVVINACKREAPKRVAARERAAAEAPKDTRSPMQKALDHCRFTHPKAGENAICRREAVRKNCH